MPNNGETLRKISDNHCGENCLKMGGNEEIQYVRLCKKYGENLKHGIFDYYYVQYDFECTPLI